MRLAEVDQQRQEAEEKYTDEHRARVVAAAEVKRLAEIETQLRGRLDEAFTLSDLKSTIHDLKDRLPDASESRHDPQVLFQGW